MCPQVSLIVSREEIRAISAEHEQRSHNNSLGTIEGNTFAYPDPLRFSQQSRKPYTIELVGTDCERRHEKSFDVYIRISQEMNDSMIRSAVNYAIFQIFDVEQSVVYVVPRFQREYIWGKEQWNHLVDDLLEEENGHFLGSILCLNKSIDELGVRPLEVIDGQQRLATISLLYAAIYQRFLNQTRNDEDYVTEKTNLKYRLLVKADQKEPKIRLSRQNRNHDDYLAILDELGLYTLPVKPQFVGVRRIYKAYQFFSKRISGFSYAELKDLLKRINSASLVKIEVETHSDAFALFESLNNRGVPLSPIDIIKNMIFAKLEINKIKSLEEASSEWEKLVENLDTHEVQERFLRQYYNAFRYDNRVTVKLGTRSISKATRSSLIRIYEALIDRNPAFIFRELVEKSKKYGMFEKPESIEATYNYRDALIDLVHIGSSPAYTFLLYLLTEYEKNTDLITGAASFLAKYFVRRHVTDTPPTRDLDDIFMRLIEHCRVRGANLDSASVINYLTKKEKFADIDTFKRGLAGKIYEESTDATRFILCAIEKENQTKEKFADLWGREDGRLIWSIEHIFPEGEDIPKHWVDMIADGNARKASELQAEWVHRLGNLTLTGFNPNLSNLPFEKKRDYKDRKGRPIGYKNGLWLNQTLREKSKWTIEDIRMRTESLVNQSVELLRLEGK